MSRGSPPPEELANLFKVLSVGTRVRIVQLLRGKTLCVNMLARQLGVTDAAVSQHLRVLRDAGVVIADKQGFHVHYSLNEETLSEWRKLADALLESRDR